MGGLPGTIIVLLQFLYNAAEKKFGVLAAQNAVVSVLVSRIITPSLLRVAQRPRQDGVRTSGVSVLYHECCKELHTSHTTRILELARREAEVRQSRSKSFSASAISERLSSRSSPFRVSPLWTCRYLQRRPKTLPCRWWQWQGDGQLLARPTEQQICWPRQPRSCLLSATPWMRKTH